MEWFEMDEYAEASSGKVRRALSAGEAADLAETVRSYIEKRLYIKAKKLMLAFGIRSV
ncbi:MAG: hypothetical protein NVSMB39_3950 [Candidatus Saccharimonadales bacterium]